MNEKDKIAPINEEKDLELNEPINIENLIYSIRGKKLWREKIFNICIYRTGNSNAFWFIEK